MRAARYRDAEDARRAGEPAPESGRAPGAAFSAVDRSAVIETEIQQAIRRGDFDGLPGAGKPLANLGGGNDPDWWIRRKIETERLTGLGPPALSLRVEDRDLHATLDRLHREADVRAAVEDFNRRVIEARRQLQGGPPVITPTRDVDAEAADWTSRRAARREAAAIAAAAEQDARPKRRRWRRA
nr:DnaJ family domain-containing protein [Agromyces seonyuensis]